jgi:hypothetical protein
MTLGISLALVTVLTLLVYRLADRTDILEGWRWSAGLGRLRKRPATTSARADSGVTQVHAGSKLITLELRSHSLRNTMMALMTVILLGASLAVILLERYSDDAEKWAFGTIGTLVGFWFRPGD